MKNISNGISSSSRRSIKNTDDYRKQVTLIKSQIGLKYKPIIQNEKSYFKKLILLIQKNSEINKSVGLLTSIKNIYLNI